MRAIIIGAGIGGLAAGIALRRAGFEVEIFERAEVMQDVGAGLSLWANALHALHQLGLGDRIRALSTPYAAAGLCTWDGRVLSAPGNAILRNDIYDRPVLDRWGEGRITLLGDAAHPMTPNLGQGACQALEDAVVLARCLRQERDPAVALRRYEAERLPRTNRLVTLSRRVGAIGQLQHPLAVHLRNAALRRISPRVQQRQLEQIVGGFV